MSDLSASHFHRTPSGFVACDLCLRHCVIAVGEVGFCGVRAVPAEPRTAEPGVSRPLEALNPAAPDRDAPGTLVTLAQDRVAAVAVDPIEKKPLYHAEPGARIFSFAVVGCNLACPWCQNHEMSQWPREHGVPMGTVGPMLPGDRLTPAELVARAVASGCRWIAATYTEPTVFFEYALEVARLARAAGLKNAWVTNGTIEQAPLSELVPFLDAANVDLKCLGDPDADRLLGVRSDRVAGTIRALVDGGVHVEVTTLIVPGFNDGPGHLERIAAFVASLGDRGIWHVSRYHPTWQWDAPATPTATLERAVAAARAAGVPYVYVGNARLAGNDGGENTRCPGCGAVLIERRGFSVRASRVTPAGRCPGCGATIPGVWG